MENESTFHRCTECSRDFKTASALAAHTRAAHKEVVALDEDVVDHVIQSARFLPPDHTGNPHMDNVPSSSVIIPGTQTVTIKKLPHYGDLPPIVRATSGSAGFDLYAAISQPICIGVNEKHAIPTGLSFEIPDGLFGLIAPRSGLATKHDITIANSPGIIDSDYRGEVICHLKNHSNTRFWIDPGMRVAQIIFTQFVAPDIIYSTELSITVRGDRGFGSTGGI